MSNLQPSSPLMSAPPQPPSTTTITTTTYDLLFDIIVTEILPKLPAKSLLRFKSVCKSFKTLISSPEFIRHHLRHSLSSENHRLFAIPAADLTLQIFDLRSLSSTTSAASATFRWPHHSSVIVGSCNGLLLITDFSGHLVILNPSTRAYINVPSTAINLGFGFDHRNDDYKIVAISGHAIVTNIYSVNSKSWRIVDCTFPQNAYPFASSGALISNHLLHWIFSITGTSKYVIRCFDVCLENWRDNNVPLPVCFSDHSDKYHLLHLGVMDDRLFIWFDNSVDLSYDAWVMKDYGVQESWMKLLSVPMSDEGIWDAGVLPVACRDEGSGEVLVRQHYYSDLFWYNRADGVITNVEGPDFENRRPYVFYDSLVALPEAKHFGAVYEPPPPDCWKEVC